jgi:hypothetical protein
VAEWERQAGDIHYFTIDIPPGITEMEIIPAVRWKFSPGYSDSPYAGCPITFLTQMSNPALNNVFGSGDQGRGDPAPAADYTDSVQSVRYQVTDCFHHFICKVAVTASSRINVPSGITASFGITAPAGCGNL